MRLLLDEMLSPQIARELNNCGHDVRAVSGNPTLEALSDRAVFDIARQERRAIVTNNIRDFRPQLALADVEHFGMIFIPARFRRTKADVGAIGDALEEILRSHPGDEELAGGEAWLG